MKKIFFLVPLMALAACNTAADDVPVEDSSCFYNIEESTKTCQLSRKERADLASTLVEATEAAPQPTGRTKFNNQDYVVYSDGTMKPAGK